MKLRPDVEKPQQTFSTISRVWFDGGVVDVPIVGHAVISREETDAQGVFFKANNFKGFFNNLNEIGYRYLKGKFRKKIIKNFQRRYRQKKVDGILDLETFLISEILAKKSNKA